MREPSLLYRHRSAKEVDVPVRFRGDGKVVGNPAMDAARSEGGADVDVVALRKNDFAASTDEDGGLLRQPE